MFYFSILIAVPFVFCLVLILISRRHKRHPSNQTFLSANAIVERQLNPEGTILVNGELWPARSMTNEIIERRTKVQVVGIDSHTLVVQAD